VIEGKDTKDAKGTKDTKVKTRRLSFTTFADSTSFAAAVLLAIIFLAFHVPYLTTSLEDLDSINFALGLREFDVANHQPHPPGYPLFIAAGKLTHRLIPSEAKALSTVSIIAAALGVIAIAALFHQLTRQRGNRYGEFAAIALAIASPLYWFTAARPLSDSTGLAAAVAVQALILAASTDRVLLIASFCAGLAAGIRSQVVWLTVPLLIARAFHVHAGEARHGSAASASSMVTVSKFAGAYVLGALIWAVPLVALSGGPAGYWRALFSQGTEDLTGIQMLWTTPTPRVFVSALYYAFVAPWAVWPVATVVLVLAAIGVLLLMRDDARGLVLVAIAFGPYLVFDIVFQETFTGRYALPLVVPTAFLAAAGAQRLSPRFGPIVIGAIAIVCAHIGGTSVAAYARTAPPAFRLLDDMRAAAPATTEPPVLAMDRREAFDLRRPIRWMRDGLPHVARTLPSPPQHEWLELVKYWSGGGRAPVWFVADPLRTDINLVQHPSPFTYRWSLPYPVLMSGVRPNEMDWYPLERPEWYVGQGWGLTPESAGVAAVERRGLQYSAIDGAIARKAATAGVMVIGGRNFEPGAGARLTVSVDGREVDAFSPEPGAFLRIVSPPIDAARNARDGNGYVPMSVRVEPPARMAIEQFDVSATRTIFGYGPGWNEPEYNPLNGWRWRWLSERGELRLMTPRGVANPRLVLHLEGESPRKYYSRPSRLVVRGAGRALFDRSIDDDFSIDVPFDNIDTLTLETDQFFAPADRSRPWRRSSDRRHLGLRIFRCEIRPAS